MFYLSLSCSNPFTFLSQPLSLPSLFSLIIFVYTNLSFFKFTLNCLYVFFFNIHFLLIAIFSLKTVVTHSIKSNFFRSKYSFYQRHPFSFLSLILFWAVWNSIRVISHSLLITISLKSIFLQFLQEFFVFFVVSPFFCKCYSGDVWCSFLSWTIFLRTNWAWNFIS